MSHGRRLLVLVLLGSSLISPLSICSAETLLGNYTFDAGATCSAMGWSAFDLSGRGNFAGLVNGSTLVQQDPSPNLTCVWEFITGSTDFYGCGGFPGQKVVPFANILGQYLHNEIQSPAIALVGGERHVTVKFDVYEDLPLDNLVFYTWKVRFLVGAAWGGWITDGVSWYRDSNRWNKFESPSAAIPPGAISVQVALGCVDNCSIWCGIYGTGACHSHAPLFDNVQVFQIDPVPVITSITDVGNDQGRRVRIVWERSLADAPGSPTPITGYGIYRRQDAFLASALHSAAAGTLSMPLPDGVNPALLAAGWDYVTTVPARAEPPVPTNPSQSRTAPLTYQTLVETLCDSTVADGQCWSVFMVSAATGNPGEFYDSLPDSGYSVDNLTPPPPAGFSVAYNVAGGNVLEWAESTAPDFNHFNIYRTTGTSLAMASGTPVHSTSGTAWQDAAGNTQHQYTIAAVDDAGNEGTAVGPAHTTGIGGKVPAGFVLHAGFPNPFATSTRLRYEVARGGGEVSLRVFDAAGRLVARLRDGVESEGEKSVVWAGRDDAGRLVPSGVYFCRMKAPGFSSTQKVIVTR